MKQDTIDGTTIPARSMVLLSPFITHRHTDYWEQPEVINPERFTADKVRARATGVYMPFGVGPRICLGTHFAALETSMVLAQVAQQWRPRMPMDTPIDAYAASTLRPRGPMMMTLERRRKA